MPLTGPIVLSDNRYGKSENRIVRIHRDGPRHEIRDVTVSTRLRGDFADAYVTGDQSAVLPTDSQKQTAYAYAKTQGLHHIEDYGLALAGHFVRDIAPVHAARVEIDEFAWERARVGPGEHDHTWVRRGPEVRTAAVTVTGTGSWVVGGVRDLVLLKSTGSEFAGFLRDEFTVLAPTDDRMLATALTARWRFADTAAVDWAAMYTGVRARLIEVFATHHSKALQQTLFEMGSAVLADFPVLAEIRLVAPNRHHFDYDLSPFGIANHGEVYYAADRPYGLIEAALRRADAPDAGQAWEL
ncbi:MULTISPECIES: factor-independent urate hydroxylase [Nocardia]|uniref:factor-independent urate hydroxylase n=1 Tax=Nocardia TaxID=1817 RepID=UPI000BEF5434|nr:MULTISPECIES: urate oxidase [Nocardia]MBF6141225.1 urate oxidase [Nocardia farcinica]MBF6186928.1 urate oxidase [Nocardia farcinica]MBF6292657.1 urate oxidase [Nocardia farcinica]MBF6311984.1 urate oxidase [Nocardia farcinica]MBF6373575.1 urate oxidase [Nocardia farcinica]